MARLGKVSTDDKQTDDTYGKRSVVLNEKYRCQYATKFNFIISDNDVRLVMPTGFLLASSKLMSVRKIAHLYKRQLCLALSSVMFSVEKVVVIDENRLNY